MSPPAATLSVADSSTSSKPSISELGFTQNLLTTLSQSREAMDSFWNRTKAKADTASISLNSFTRAEEKNVKSLRAKINDLQRLRGVAADSGGIEKERKAMLEMEIQITRENEDLRRRGEDIEREYIAILNEETEHRIKAEEVRFAKLRVEESKITTVDDLTKGILYYNTLGLDFGMVGENLFRFTFTQLDSNNPQRRFCVILNTGNDHGYEIEECRPPLEIDVTSHLLKTLNLNPNENLKLFVRGIRKAFKNTL
mmetsp:Transcript_12419/g.15537  ORF Transcript_12419/g.15537 Transcript_12419/m.15537 type:complete len:255 (-) Transcript_12419:19-783(-)|eukprot:CAMPEP_0172512620 /NCGR_PEP_ID=MMETSP1066-20121228/245986_1 /TAXON_ID=671091 /ORGANISM="Coscinodiscus wailesii, Strain CCMP2513" /LENGTH=254 /DNA_ID=CAMNT_0013292523 /DNA_START=75 /DNA_END=839 /DNA_ORIENTATION=+